MMRMRSFLVTVISGTCMTLLGACKSEVPEEQPPANGYIEQGLGDSGRLSKAEWTTYIADQRYIHSLVQPNTRIRLNLADKRQHRFAVARLKLAGKTPENSPYLFEAMEQRRQKHLALGYKEGLLSKEEFETQSTTARREMHQIEVATAGETTAVINDGKGSASSTFPGGSEYTYVDASYTDANGYPLGEMGWAEEFGGGYNVTIPTAGNLALTNLKRYMVSSYKTEDSAAGFTDSYIYSKVGPTNAVTIAEAPRLMDPITVEAPVDLVSNDKLISICLNRTWTQDCDYDLTGNPQSIKLPLKGSLSIASNHTFDYKMHKTITQDLNATSPRPRPDAGSLSLILTNVGGGCDVTSGNTINASMAQFWNSVVWSNEVNDPTTPEPDYKTLSWDLTGNNSAFFDDDCRQIQNRVKLTLVIGLYLRGGGVQYWTTATITTDPTTPRAAALNPITITNSCLAAGTEIELAAGKSGTIESLKMGDRVFNPYQKALTVMDMAIGFETVPMVRIRSEAGRSLLMTEMHPIQVVGRGMVQARALQKGDMVMTKSGPSKLVEVSREAYDGKVYNLKVGSDAEKLALAEDQTVVYANGFMVGDGQIQSKYETITMTRKPENVLARLSSRWHRDYLMSTRGK